MASIGTLMDLQMPSTRVSLPRLLGMKIYVMDVIDQFIPMFSRLLHKMDFVLSHNNPCFPCNIAITNFLILYTCEIRFYDVIDRTVHTFTSCRHPKRKFQNMAK